MTIERALLILTALAGALVLTASVFALVVSVRTRAFFASSEPQPAGRRSPIRARSILFGLAVAALVTSFVSCAPEWWLPENGS